MYVGISTFSLILNKIFFRINDFSKSLGQESSISTVYSIKSTDPPLTQEVKHQARKEEPEIKIDKVIAKAKLKRMLRHRSQSKAFISLDVRCYKIRNLIWLILWWFRWTMHDNKPRSRSFKKAWVRTVNHSSTQLAIPNYVCCPNSLSCQNWWYYSYIFTHCHFKTVEKWKHKL